MSKSYLAKLNEEQDKIIQETANKIKDLGLIEKDSRYELTKFALYCTVILFNRDRVNEFRNSARKTDGGNNGKE